MTWVRSVRNWYANLPLFWQIFLPNGVVLVVAIALLALTPASVPSRITTAQALELIAAAVLIILISLLLIRRAVRPVGRVTELMERIDPLQPGQRAPTDGGSAEMTRLAAVFNEMLDRLEAERRESGAKMLSAQERERVRLSRELHDEIGQSLTGLMLELDRVAGRAPPELSEELAETREMARGIGGEVREIVRRLRPEALDDLGLQSAIVALTEQFTDQAAIPVQRRVERDLPALSDEAELVVYRIAQESLTNVARHSQASAVELELGAAKTSEAVVLRVADNGRAAEPLQPRSGIQGMRERAMLVDGRLAIEVAPEGGVEVRLTVPVAAS